MAEIDTKRAALLQWINNVAEQQKALFDQTLKDACILARFRLDEQIDREQDRELAELRKAIHRMSQNQSNGSLLLDLVFSIAITPLFSRLLDATLTKLTSALIGYRESIIKLSQEIDNLGGTRGKWAGISSTAFTPEVNRRIETILITAPNEIRQRQPTISFQKLFEYFTPIVKEKATAAGDRATTAIKAAGAPPAPATVSDPVKESYERLKDINRLTLAKILDDCQNYATTQIRIVMDNAKVARWLALTHPDEAFLDKLADEYMAKLSDLPAFDDKNLKRDIAGLLEAVMWIYYLGKPETWGFHRYRGEPRPSDYFPGNAQTQPYERGPYVTSLERQGSELEDVFAFKVRLSQSLLDYLLDDFTPPGTDDSFRKAAWKQKRTALGRASGPGITTRDPRSGWEWDWQTGPRNYIQWSPEKPITNPTSTDYNADDLAAHTMVKWFRDLERSLSQGEQQLFSLLAANGIKPVPRRSY
jgi:hypothetical protein